MKKNVKTIIIIGAAIVFAAAAWSAYFLMTPSSGAASQKPVLRAAAGAFDKNGQVDVTVSIENNPGIAGMNFQLHFDGTQFAPSAIKKGEHFQSVISNMDQGGEFPELPFVTATWVSPANITTNGDIITVTFQAKPEATAADFSIRYEPADIADEDLNEVSIEVIDAVNVTLP
ncbi:MAG: cohesin domain-containing protein [Clostridiales bacterium]|jgi:hypothetical protein|nr:cohesin domain-containing protein [Clostridiales bacterium]